MALIRSLPLNNIEDNNIENIVDSIKYGICIIDNKNYVSYINKYFTKLLNISKHEIINRKVFKIINNSVIHDSIKSKANKSGFFQNSDGKMLKISTNIIYDENELYNGIVLVYSEEENKNTNNIITIKKDDIKNPYPEIKSNDSRFIRELKKAYKASKSNANILITGESGTGKEIIANEIHNSSKRSAGKFVAVNCGAIPENLLESYLFGHKKGAFTGAINDKIGQFEYANGGTLFLDEIGELPLSMQVKLLRVIQERKISKIGCNKLIDIDIRIVAATNNNLESMIEKNKFRKDLYYRLNVIPINLIPLRQRCGDIEILIEHFKNEYLEINNIEKLEISEVALEALNEYEWPGNIRELKNIIERLIVLMEDSYIDYYDLPSTITNYYSEISNYAHH